MSELRKPMTRASLISSLDSAAGMSEFLLYAAAELMASNDTPSPRMAAGFADVCSMVNRELRTCVDAIEDVFAGEDVRHA